MNIGLYQHVLYVSKTKMISLLGILCNHQFQSEVFQISNSNYDKFTYFIHSNFVYIICGISIVVTPSHGLPFKSTTIE